MIGNRGDTVHQLYSATVEEILDERPQRSRLDLRLIEWNLGDTGGSFKSARNNRGGLVGNCSHRRELTAEPRRDCPEGEGKAITGGRLTPK